MSEYRDSRINSDYYEQPESMRIGHAYYEQPETSQVSYEYEQPESSETEEDRYDYTSPAPVDYEVPDNASDATTPETPQRELGRPAAPLPPKIKNSKYRPKLYTTLTHTHAQSVYSTPSHSTEFRTNTAVSGSMLDITSIETGLDFNGTRIPINKEADALPKSRAKFNCKVAVFIFLVVAVVIGMISLVVSVVAVIVTRESGSTDLVQEMEALQKEVMELQVTVEQTMNQTRGMVDLSELYEGCTMDMNTKPCNTAIGLGSNREPCVTNNLPVEKEVSDRETYAVSSRRSELFKSFFAVNLFCTWSYYIFTTC